MLSDVFFLLPEIFILSCVHLGGDDYGKNKQENLSVDQKLLVKKEPERAMLLMSLKYKISLKGNAIR